MNEPLEHGNTGNLYARKLIISTVILLVYVVAVAMTVGIARHLMGIEPHWQLLAIVAASSFLAGFASLYLTLWYRDLHGPTMHGGLIGMIPRDGIPALCLFTFIALGGTSGKIGASFVLIFFVTTLPVNVWLILEKPAKVAPKKDAEDGVDYENSEEN